MVLLYDLFGFIFWFSCIWRTIKKNLGKSYWNNFMLDDACSFSNWNHDRNFRFERPFRCETTIWQNSLDFKEIKMASEKQEPYTTIIENRKKNEDLTEPADMSDLV